MGTKKNQGGNIMKKRTANIIYGVELVAYGVCFAIVRNPILLGILSVGIVSETIAYVRARKICR